MHATRMICNTAGRLDRYWLIYFIILIIVLSSVAVYTDQPQQNYGLVVLTLCVCVVAWVNDVYYIMLCNCLCVICSLVSLGKDTLNTFRNWLGSLSNT